MNRNRGSEGRLPFKGNLTRSYLISVIIAILMAVASGIGLLNGAAVYPTDELFQSFMPTDVTLILIGLPMFLGSIALARRGKLIGLLLWPGAPFFVLYNYLAYLVAMPFGSVFLLYLTLVVVSVYALIGLVAGIDAEEVRRRLTGRVPERAGGGILAGLGLLFLLRAASILVGALVSQTPLTEIELAVNMADILCSPIWVAGGVLLWRRQPLGYVAGLGLLFQASMLFIALIIVLAVQPLLTEEPLAIVDIVVVSIMGLIAFVPFGLHVRGVLSGSAATHQTEHEFA